MGVSVGASAGVGVGASVCLGVGVDVLAAVPGRRHGLRLEPPPQVGLVAMRQAPISVELAEAARP